MQIETSEIKGVIYTIKFCKGAFDSFAESLETVSPTNKRKSLEYDIHALLLKLANGEKINEIVSESDKGNIKFYAIKKIPIRCYLWYSKIDKKCIYVSHFIHKKQQKLAKKDQKRVERNWRAMELNK